MSPAVVVVSHIAEGAGVAEVQVDAGQAHGVLVVGPCEHVFPVDVDAGAQDGVSQDLDLLGHR